MNNNFCVYPFIQMVVRTDRSIGPCCLINKFSSLDNETVTQAWHNQSFTELRNKMLISDEPIEECRSCSLKEQTLGFSDRTQTLTDYGFIHPNLYHKILEYKKYKNLPFPKRLELHIGNTCNLKCLTCRPQDSSMFLAENNRLGLSHENQKDYMLDDSYIEEIFNLINTNDLEMLDLRGGESLLIPKIKQCLQDLPPEKSKQITLRIQTNSTIWSDDWAKIFSKFKSIEIMLSLDAVGTAAEYIRYPCSWAEIVDNIKQFKSIKHKKLYINCTVSNMSFLRLDQLLKWSKDNDVYCHLSMLTNPDIYRYDNLPTELFEAAKQRLSTVKDYPGVSGFMNRQSQFDLLQWQKFCQMIDIRDSYRNNRIFTAFPELESHWVS